MNDYLQPEFYRFNEDSLKLVKKAAERVNSAKQILDLGAGSGIIGIEAANFFNPELLVLVELQPEFQSFIQHNIRTQLRSKTITEVHIKSFSDWRHSQKFDLVLVNPPYYLPGRGQRSKDPAKDKARSFLVDNWDILARCFSDSLSAEGRGYIVLKKDKVLINEAMKSLKDFSIHMIVEEDLVFFELARLNVD